MTDWTNPAAWYDVLNPWGPSDDFYLDLVMAADSVLDVGCGTGTLLHRARDAGHTGRLCGLDPDPFETRHPQARAWEGWTTSFAVRNPDGDVAWVSYELQEVTGELVRFTETLSGKWWDRLLHHRDGLQ